MKVPRLGIVVAGLAAAVDLALVLVGAPEWARIPFGLLMVLVLPGYVWQMALSSGDDTPLRMLVITVMSSIGIAIVTGLLLNVIPGGLTARTWAVALTVIAGVGVITSLVSGGGKHTPHSTPSKILPTLRPAAGIKIAAALGCVLVAGAISLSSQHAENASEHFTTLSLKGINGNTPTVTVANHQGRRASYQLSVSADGQLLSTELITLGAGSRVTKSLSPYVPSSSQASLIRVTLALPGSATIYRDVWFEAS
jgi:hypothetical protein